MHHQEMQPGAGYLMTLLLGHALAVLDEGGLLVMTGAGVLNRVKPEGNSSVSVAKATSVEKMAKSVTSNSSPVKAVGGIVLAGRKLGCGAGVWQGMCVRESACTAPRPKQRSYRGADSAARHVVLLHVNTVCAPEYPSTPPRLRTQSLGRCRCMQPRC
jgi:hypothetical protein